MRKRILFVILFLTNLAFSVYGNNMDAVEGRWSLGKTQTQYPRGTWTKKYTDEPKIWFHNISRSHRSAFNDNEIAFIKCLASNDIITNTAQTISLDQLDINKCKSEALPAMRNHSVAGKKIKIDGREFESGVGVLAPSEFKIKLFKDARRFTAWVGMNDEVVGDFPGWRKTVFKVFGDGEKIWDSGPVKPGDTARRIDIDVAGMDEIELIFDATHFDFAQGSWADAVFTFEGQRPVALKIPEREKYILTPHLSDVPQINGPERFGVRPGHPVFYKIPASGKKPMRYSVRHLPKGLSIDKRTGVIGGKIRNAGDYKMTLLAKNSLGKTQKDFTLSVGDTICLTPPMGWNSWNCWGESVDDEKIRASAKAMVESGLIDHGWTYINIDDCWQGPRDPKTGRVTSNEKFPDMKALADYVHSLGLKIGLYTCCGPLTCAKFTGSDGYESQDIQTYAEWGFDYVKIDWCHCGDKIGAETYPIYGEAIKTVNRDIVFSICEWGLGEPWLWGEKAGGNCWRTTEDIADNWQCILEIGFEKQVSLEHYAGPGHWNDPDMLVVGKVGWGPHLHDSRLTPDEQYTHISLWSLLASPMLIGCDLSNIDDFTFNLLTNDEVLSVNQDPLGKQAEQIMSGKTQIWVKEMADGSKAVGLFNLTRKPQSIKLDFDTIGFDGKVKVRDLWRKTEVGICQGSYSINVPAHGVFLARVISTDK